MIPSYSVAEARDRFAQILHDLQTVSRIEVTRRGQPVAVLISMEEYERLCLTSGNFWDAYVAFRERFTPDVEGIEPETFEGLRHTSAGREVHW